MTVTAQCRNMVEQQIRTWEVLDERVLDSYYDVPRDAFVPPDLTQLAFVDTQLPIGYGQMSLEPKVEARILQELGPHPNEKILHVGTGTGYFAALLGKLCGMLVTVEIIPQLAKAAEQRLAAHGLSNVRVLQADGLAAGSVDGGPFDAAVLTGSVPVVPTTLLEHLTEGSRLVVPVGEYPVSTVALFRHTHGTLIREDLFDTWVPPLANAPTTSHFDF